MLAPRSSRRSSCRCSSAGRRLGSTSAPVGQHGRIESARRATDPRGHADASDLDCARGRRRHRRLLARAGERAAATGSVATGTRSQRTGRWPPRCRSGRCRTSRTRSAGSLAVTRRSWSRPDGATAWDLETTRSCRAMPRHREPEPLAPGETRRIPWPVRVVPGIYQVRGYDLSNLTLIEGRTAGSSWTRSRSRKRRRQPWRWHASISAIGRCPPSFSRTATWTTSAVSTAYCHRDRRRCRSWRPQVHGGGDQRERARRRRHGPPRALYVWASLPRGVTGHVDTGLGKGVPYGTIGIRVPRSLSIALRRRWISTACGSSSSTPPTPRRRRR